MRTTVDIPDALLRRARQLAEARGRTLSAVVVDALRSALSRPAPSEQPEPFRLVTFAGTSAWPDLDFDRASELVAAEDELGYRVAEPPAAYGPRARGKGRKGPR
jgi:hypothetical protein